MKIVGQQPAVTSSPASSTFDTGLKQIGQFADQAMSGLSGLGDSFSGLFSEAAADKQPEAGSTGNSTENSAKSSTQTLTESLVKTLMNDTPATTALTAANPLSSPDAIDNIQQKLLSSLGLNFAGIDSEGINTGFSADSITSAGSLDALQGALLSSLQANLFTAKPAEQANTSLTTNDAANASTKTTASTAAAANVSTATTKAKSTAEGTQTKDDLQQNPVDAENSLLDSITEFSFGNNGLELSDAFDSVNILQHIPIVSSVYQNMTEHDISAVAKLTGGYLYGGPLGLALSAVDLTVESLTGHSVNNTLANFDYNGLFGGLIAGASESSEQTAAADIATSAVSTGMLEQLPKAYQFARRAIGN